MRIHNLFNRIDLSGVILWQYNNAKRLKGIVKLVEEGVNAASVELWEKSSRMFDLETPIDENSDDFMFRMYGLYALSSLFKIPRPSYVSNGALVELRPDTWRRYIKGMVWLMDSDCSVPDINKWLKIVFPHIPTARVVDNLDMTIYYIFPENIDDEDLALINLPDFLPHPAGVLINERQDEIDRALGFDPNLNKSIDDSVRGNFSHSHFVNN